MQVIPKYISGIYSIVNKTNNKFYIGSAIDIRERIYIHFGQLRKNKHHSPHLQKSYNKYGENNFTVEILAKCPKEYLIKLEQWFIDTQNPNYNVCKTAGSMLGTIKSEESKQKLRDTHKLNWETKGSYKINRTQIEEIKELLKKGYPQKEIAKKFDVAISTVSKIKRRYSIECDLDHNLIRVNISNKKYPENFIKEMQNKFIKSNCSIYRFIKDNNLTETFYNLLREVNTHKRKQLSQNEVDEIKELLKGNLTQTEIGNKFGVVNSYISYLNKKFKIRQ